jgi:hypothetical protein
MTRTVRALALAGALVAVLSPSSRAAAEEATVEPHRVSLPEALAAAQRLPENTAAQAGERAAEARVHVAGALGEPGIAIQTNSVTAREAAVFSLPIPLARGPRVAAAKADVTFASKSRAEIGAEARRTVRVAWFSLAAAEERAKAATERAARAERKDEVGETARAVNEPRATATVGIIRSRNAIGNASARTNCQPRRKRTLPTSVPTIEIRVRNNSAPSVPATSVTRLAAFHLQPRG